MKKKTKLVYRLVMPMLIALLSSCYYDQEEILVPDDKVVSFAVDIQPIFNTNCTSCHPIIVSPPDLTEGNSYNAITNDNYIISKDLEASTLYQKLLGNPNIMPPSGSLPTSEINLIRSWIEQGALNN